ncbi:MAG: hypothetical protein ACYSUY_02630 [Planctomycetota bacterium]|jgi:hypothetical protein
MKKLLIIFIISIAILISYVASIYIRNYEGEINEIFQTKLSQCDKIVIRDGGYTCHGDIDTHKILMTITDPKEIDEFIKSIEFSIFQREVACACCGWPGIDFYSGSERIMVTSVQHNKALRTPIAQYDLKLNSKSTKFMENLTRRFVRK